MVCSVYVSLALTKAEVPSILLRITEEVRVCTGQRTISAFVLYYSNSQNGRPGN